jgi:hypothetical protein
MRPSSASLPRCRRCCVVQVYKRVVQRAMLYGPWQVMPWRLDNVLCPLDNCLVLVG